MQNSFLQVYKLWTCLYPSRTGNCYLVLQAPLGYNGILKAVKSSSQCQRPKVKHSPLTGPGVNISWPLKNSIPRIEDQIWQDSARFNRGSVQCVLLRALSIDRWKKIIILSLDEQLFKHLWIQAFVKYVHLIKPVMFPLFITSALLNRTLKELSSKFFISHLCFYSKSGLVTHI